MMIEEAWHTAILILTAFLAAGMALAGFALLVFLLLTLFALAKKL